MYQIAANPAYQCPEAILIILGGNPADKWSMKGYIFKYGNKYVELSDIGFAKHRK